MLSSQHLWQRYLFARRDPFAFGSIRRHVHSSNLHFPRSNIKEYTTLRSLERMMLQTAALATSGESPLSTEVDMI